LCTGNFAKFQKYPQSGNTELFGPLMNIPLQKCRIVFEDGEFEALQRIDKAELGVLD
jgi:hypothetical protein